MLKANFADNMKIAIYSNMLML